MEQHWKHDALRSLADTYRTIMQLCPLKGFSGTCTQTRFITSYWHIRLSGFVVFFLFCFERREYEGDLVVYGSFVVLDVQWLATILKPLCSHKQMSMGEVNLGGITVKPSPRLNRLVDSGILEPKLAAELWPKSWEYLLNALDSAGLTFRLPDDKEEGLVFLLRLPHDRPEDVREVLERFRLRTHEGRIKASCTFTGGVPPGFIERLLSICCRLGSCKPFWRNGVLIQFRTRFAVILEYFEDDNNLVGTLTLEAFGDTDSAGPWLAMSACLSVLRDMLREFRGVEAEAELSCLSHAGDDLDRAGAIPIDLQQV